MQILVLHGPNLNLLGEREPDVYGSATLQTINTNLAELAQSLDVEVVCFQSNVEGVLVDRIQQAASGLVERISEIEAGEEELGQLERKLHELTSKLVALPGATPALTDAHPVSA